MDRIASFLPWRLIAPLMLATVTAAAWLWIRTGAPPAVGDIPPVRMYHCDTPSGECVQPGLFRPSQSAQCLAPAGEQTRLVLVAKFGDGTDRAEQSGEAKGPKLIGSVAAAPQTPAALSVRPDLTIPPQPLRSNVARDEGDRRTQGTAGEAANSRSSEPPPALPNTNGSLLLPAAPAAERSEQLENIARQADRQIRRGFGLANRQAHFAARAAFVAALRLVAQGLDAEQHTNLHSRALAAGLTAIREADDFLPAGSRLEADLDLPGIVGSHCTPVLKDVDVSTLAPLPALKCYFTFAQEQFAVAAGHEVAGSMALGAMGKLHATLVRSRTSSVRGGESKAMVFYQAALLAFPQNYMAANDLGVLLAECGNYPEARAMLEYSLAICPQSTGWRNLSVVYQQLGLAELSQRTTGQAEAAQRAELARLGGARSAVGVSVQWLDSQGFAQSYGDAPLAREPLPARSPAPQASGCPVAAGQPAPAQRPASPPAAEAPATPATAHAFWPWQQTR